MFKCSICLDNYNLSNSIINTTCGHTGVCKNCHQIRINRINRNNIECPICRQRGNYIINRINFIDNDIESQTLNDNNSDDNFSIEINNYVPTIIKDILNNNLSPNYYKKTFLQNNSVYFNNENINMTNLHKAYYGSELDIYNNNNPNFYNVTNKIKMALNIGRDKFKICDNYLLDCEIYKENNWLLVIILYS